MAEEIKIPAAPRTLPPKLQSDWRKKYVGAYKQSQADYPDNPVLQEQFALREANLMLRSPELKSYQDAVDLQEHQLARTHEGKPARQETEDGKLKVVTADGKKYSFDVPAKKKKDDEPLNPATA
jgi:hypothetical protein